MFKCYLWTTLMAVDDYCDANVAVSWHDETTPPGGRSRRLQTLDDSLAHTYSQRPPAAGTDESRRYRIAV